MVCPFVNHSMSVSKLHHIGQRLVRRGSLWLFSEKEEKKLIYFLFSKCLKGCDISIFSLESILMRNSCSIQVRAQDVDFFGLSIKSH
jgi:hypothetical protein